MTVINRLASALGRRDDVPNQELAEELVERKAAEDIKELVVNLRNRDRKIQSDCIKVLYEIGYRDPSLIADYVDEFLALLGSRNNRLVWGGMSALATIAEHTAPVLYEHRAEIQAAIENGSVITVDRGIKVLSTVAAQKDEYRTEIFPYLLDHLRRCRPKDVARDAEAISSAVSRENRTEFIRVLEARLPDLQPSQAKRVKKVLTAAQRL